MPGFSPELIADIANTTLDTYLNRGEVFKNNIQNKPMLKAFDEAAGKFAGGKANVSIAVSAGQGGGALQGFTGDDQVSYYNPVGTKRFTSAWKEHHIGTVVTMSELKVDGIDVDESDGGQSTSEMAGRDFQALADRMDEKNEMLGEDFSKSLDLLIHQDGSSDTKALAGLQSLILAVPNTGTTGSINRVANPWWRNRAATAAFAAAGGQNAITVSATNGGALVAFLQKEVRQLKRFSSGSSKWKWFAGSDWLDGYLLEIRANGQYSQKGWRGEGSVNAAMDDPAFGDTKIEYDPTLDDMGLAKRCYVIDISKRGIRLEYMDGQKMKKHKPSRPYDRYVIYNGITMTGLMVARQLNTSAVYDIA